MTLTLISSPRFAEHETPPGHPERSERADVFDAVAARFAAAGGAVLAPRMALREELARVHSEPYLDSIERTAGRPTALDPDTYTSPESYEIALLAAGATVAAMERALATPGERVMALVRPPGHHAEADRAMGFCIYNNAAVAAAAAIGRGVERVAIVDYDVHHGNATQWMFYESPRVLYVSLHQYPFYPGTGAADEVGVKEGRGYTVNVPLEAGATDADYDSLFRSLIVPVLDAFSPRLLILSAGFDAHMHDPLGSMRVSAKGYAAMTRHLLNVAVRHCRGSMIAVTEGGYNLEALAACLESAMAVLNGREDAASFEFGTPTHRARQTEERVRKVQTPYWPDL
jgi:acetoin utilization deacetylase AcuC-like enzyme